MNMTGLEEFSASARFKEMLESKGQLEAWYEFERKAAEEALHGWCRKQYHFGGLTEAVCKSGNYK